MGFGQHQSFYLRERWLSKGIKELGKDRNFFNDINNFERIGLGKNMFNSLKFWMGATNIIEENNRIISLSDLGDLIYKYDKFLNNVFTKLLIHYYLAINDNTSNKYSSTVIYWLFNEFSETVFTKEIASEQFFRWVDKNISREIKQTSIDKELSMALQLYTIQNFSRDPEEVAISPLSSLQLIKRDEKRYVKSEMNFQDIPSEIIMVYLIDYYNKTENNYITIEELISKRLSIGKILNISRSTLISKLDELMDRKNNKYKISFTRTNNLDTITIPENLNIIEYIEYVFEGMYKNE